MNLSIIGAGGIKDNLLFETYISRVIKTFKEPIDKIITDGGSDRGISKLGIRFAKQHHLVLIQCRIEDINRFNQGLFIIWFGKDKKLKAALEEAISVGHMTYEVRLDKGGFHVNKYNTEDTDATDDGSH